jgi:hypothetical protein
MVPDFNTPTTEMNQKGKAPDADGWSDKEKQGQET